MGKPIQEKTLKIGIYSNDPEKLNENYLDLVLNDRFDDSLDKKYFAVGYESMNGNKHKGTVTITGNLNILEICNVLSRSGFKLTSINEKKLEDLGNEVISKLEEIVGGKK